MKIVTIILAVVTAALASQCDVDEEDIDREVYNDVVKPVLTKPVSCTCCETGYYPPQDAPYVYGAKCFHATAFSVGQHQVSASYTSELNFYDSVIEKIPLGSFHLPQDHRIVGLFMDSVYLLEIEPKAFSNLNNLVSLNMANNYIQTLSPGIFGGLNSLQQLDLSTNKIRGVLGSQNLTGLGESLVLLNLAHNFITSIDPSAFNHFTHLEAISMINNKIKCITGNIFQQNKLLTIIDLSDNKIRSIENGTFHTLAKINAFGLSHNSLTECCTGMFSGYQNQVVRNISVKTLDISWNKLEDIFFGSSLKVENLYMQHNEITKIPVGQFSKFDQLKELRLDQNKIKEIKLGSFSGAYNLKHLNLSHNEIKDINPAVFFGLKNVWTLILSHNLLTTLPAAKMVRYLKSLKTLGINHNNFTCPDLSNILHELDVENLSIASHGAVDYHLPNIAGIGCTPVNVTIPMVGIGDDSRLDSSTKTVHLTPTKGMENTGFKKDREDYHDMFSNQSQQRPYQIFDSTLLEVRLNEIHNVNLAIMAMLLMLMLVLFYKSCLQNIKYMLSWGYKKQTTKPDIELQEGNVSTF